MKAKLIRSDKASTFQQELNSFIEGKKIVDIKYATFLATLEYTGTVPTKSTVFDSALVMYEEEEE